MKIDFYLLAENTPLMRTACRLLDKTQANQNNPRVFVYAPDQGVQAELNRLLWVWQEQSFLPHGIENTPDADGAPIVIGSVPPEMGFEILLNLAQTPNLPPNWSAFARVLELVEAMPIAKQHARQRWQTYKKAGLANLQLGSHNIG